MKDIAASFGWPRTVPSLAFSLLFMGGGLGGILMGWWLDKAGMGKPALVGAVMVGAGAMLTVSGQIRTFPQAVDFGVSPSASFTREFDREGRWFDGGVTGRRRQARGPRGGVPRSGGNFSPISISTRAPRRSSAVIVASVRGRYRTGGASVGRRALSGSRRRLWRLVGMSSLISGTAWYCGFGGRGAERLARGRYLAFDATDRHAQVV